MRTMRAIRTTTVSPSRLPLVLAAVTIQMALGGVMAWSVYRIPFAQAYGWTTTEVTLTYTIHYFAGGLASLAGGVYLSRLAPRLIGVVAATLYAIGILLTSLTDGHLWVLYLSYGVLGGVGTGFGYVVSITTLLKWFPDQRGRLAGVASAGYGLGTLAAAPVATSLVADLGLLPSFRVLGLTYFVAMIASALLLKNPPDGYSPPGWQPSPQQDAQRTKCEYTLPEVIRTWQCWALWAIILLHGSAGHGLTSQAAAIARELTAADALAAAGVVGALGVANTLGRLAWASLSDQVGRREVFLAMFLIQAVCLFLLPLSTSLIGFAMLTAIVVLCYGGGWSTLPAIVADYFGAKHLGATFGVMMTSIAFAASLGPLLLAYGRDLTGGYSGACYGLAAIMLAGATLVLVLRPPTAPASVRHRIPDPRPIPEPQPVASTPAA